MKRFPDPGSAPGNEPLPDRFPTPPADRRFRRSDPLPETREAPGSAGSGAASRFRRSISGSGEAPRGAAPCRQGPTGRVLPGRHDPDTCTGDLCAGCEPCCEQHCTTCRTTHTSNGTCPTCLGMARSTLDALLLQIADLPEEATTGRQAYRAGEGIPGGDALVLLTPALTHTRQPRYVRPELPADPRPPLDVLGYWAAQWAHHQGLRLHWPLTLGNVASYLDGQLHLIAGSPLFPHLERDLRRLLHSVENVLYAGDRPEVSRVPCWECGTRLHKVYADQPARDHWRCPSCGEIYDRGRYDRAKHDHLASRGADRYVPVSDAIAATGRPEKTVRDWIRRQLVAATRDPDSGRLLVWWPDVRARHLATPTRRRRSA